MELQDLKQKWNILDERLSKSEVYNKRALEEIIKGKNQTTYEKLYKSGIFNFFYTFLIAAALIQLLHSKEIFHDTSFYILEGVCVLGIVMVGIRLTILSRFNVMKTPAGQLSNLVNYKRCYVYETVIGIPLVILGICTTLYFEHTTSPLGIFFIILGLLAGASCCYFGWKKHKSTMAEIEQNLAELKDFE